MKKLSISLLISFLFLGLINLLVFCFLSTLSQLFIIKTLIHLYGETNTDAFLLLYFSSLIIQTFITVFYLFFILKPLHNRMDKLFLNGELKKQRSILN